MDLSDKPEGDSRTPHLRLHLYLYFRRRLEMQLCTLAEDLSAGFCNELRADDFDLRTGAAGQFALAELVELFHTADEAVAGKDTGGGNGDIAFRFGFLFEHDLSSAFHKGIFDQVFIAELI